MNTVEWYAVGTSVSERGKTIATRKEGDGGGLDVMAGWGSCRRWPLVGVLACPSLTLPDIVSRLYFLDDDDDDDGADAREIVTSARIMRPATS